MEHKTLTKQGYAVLKDKLTKTEITAIKKDCNVKPITFLKEFNTQDQSFNIYSESKRRYWLPKYYGIIKYGDPVANLIPHGNTINIDFKLNLKEHQKNPFNKTLEQLEKEEGGILSLPCGFGKCLGYNTPVMLYDGSVKMVQCITKDDVLIGDDSMPRKILSVCTGKEKLYKIKQAYGIDYIVNESHILTLKHKVHGIVDIALKDFLKETVNQSNYYSIKSPINYNFFFCTSSYAYLIGMYYALCEPIIEPIQMYSKGTQLIRNQFLAGIIDYTPEIKQEDCYGLIFENYEILETTKNVANSLGYGIKQEEYCLFIYSNTNIQVIKKEKKISTKHLDSNIIVEELCVGDYYGFTIDGNRRFLLGDCTVTHNTALAIKLICTLKRKAIVVVHKEFLMEQWKESIQKFTDARVGIIQQNKLELDADICIGMIHSLCLKDYPQGTFDSFGTMVIDECHHLGSEMFSKVLMKIGTCYRLGLSATPTRRDGLHTVYNMHIGNIAHKEKRTGNNQVKIKILNLSSESEFYKTIYNGKMKNTSAMVTNITNCGQRNELLVKLLLQLNKLKRKVILLSSRREHLELLYTMIKEREKNEISVGFYYGNQGMGKKAYKEMLNVSSKCDIILATEQLAKEGLDIPDLDTLIMSTSISDLGALEQSIGRILRKFYNDSNYPLVYDIVDKNCGNFSKHGTKRKKFYKDENYNISITSINIDNGEEEINSENISDCVI
jgi:superfamily II DNA or RNA helicase|uniref:Helicase ATP-binding domain-containing protein n=1 Tax=viral metagenome TaxID=1070528 RepID=A0A6C0J4H3_9ZZZZ